MIFNLTYGHLLVIVFLFLTSLNCVVTYLCSNSALKTFIEKKSYKKAINKIRMYDKYLLSFLILITSAIYTVCSYIYFLDILVISDYFLTLAICLGFVLSLITTFVSRLCYCYACNVLLKTRLNEWECFVGNFFYLIRVFFPIFVISFFVPTVYILPIANPYRVAIVITGIILFFALWILSAPIKTMIAISARKIQNPELRGKLSRLFEENKVSKYELYYWDSSKSNEANAMVSGFFKHYLFVSSTLVEKLNDRELTAVILHEIGHIKKYHPIKLLISKLLLLSFVSILLYYIIMFGKVNIWLLLFFVFIFVLLMGMNLQGDKDFEDQADLFVAKKGYGEDLISALKKTDIVDITSNKLDEFFSSHPMLATRESKIKNKSGGNKGV